MPAEPRTTLRHARPPALGTALLSLALLAASCSASGSAHQRSSASPADPLAATSTTASAEAPAEPATGTLDWTDCDGGFECATLDVPVDHDQPDGDTLELALVRRPASDPEQRIGALLMNPGGPGGSAIDLVEGLPLSPEVTARFDIVGFDPRGVGRSSPLDCHTHLQDIYDADPTFEDAADRTTYLKVSQEFVDECEAKYGDLLPHLGTTDVAKDMDEVRAALGDDQLSYLGYSYGTSIGEQYARLFPERVRAMVLDGVVDPGVTGLEAAEGQAKGFTGALDAFIAACDDQGCGLDIPAAAAVDGVIAASEAKPIPAPGSDRPATAGVVALALGQALYSESLWPDLANALDDGLAGDGDGLVNLADQYLGRNGDGTYATGFEIYFAVNCIDSAWPRDPQAVFDDAKRVGAEYPRVGEALVNDYARCALWPVPPQPLPEVPADLQGLAPIVVISTTGDPATPYESGVAVAKQIPGAVLISNEGEGHTIYGQGKDCVDDAVNTYLVSLDPPEDGLSC